MVPNMSTRAKKGGFPRLCADHLKLNSIAVRSSSALPKKNEWTESFGNSKIFSTFDSNAASREMAMDGDVNG